MRIIESSTLHNKLSFHHPPGENLFRRFSTLLTRLSSYPHWRIIEFDPLIWQTAHFLQNCSLSFFKQCPHGNTGWLKFLSHLQIQNIIIGSCASDLSRWADVNIKLRNENSSPLLSSHYHLSWYKHPPEILLLLIFLTLKYHISLNQKCLQTILLQKSP